MKFIGWFQKKASLWISGLNRGTLPRLLVLGEGERFRDFKMENLSNCFSNKQAKTILATDSHTANRN